MSVPNPERGVAPQRLDFAREDYLGTGSFGTTPTNPSFLKYSDNITTFSAQPNAVIERRGGLGSPDPTSFERGPETGEVTVGYDLVKWFGSATGDAAYDGIERQGDNLLPDSHSLVAREDKTVIQSGETVSGNTARGTRLYTYARGGLIDEGTITGDPSDQQPINVELTYTFQYLRPVQIDQPTSTEAPTELVVNSTAAGDTGLVVTIEDEGGTTAEDVTLDAADGTTIVTTSSTFSDVDAVYVSGANTGNIEVAINTGTATAPTKGDVLCKVYGSGTYDDVESDYGVPPLGTGSRETVGSLGAVENFLGDTIQSDNSPYRYRVQSIALSFANNLETTEVADQLGMEIHPGNRNLTWEATVFGEAASIDALQAHLQNVSRSQEWQLTGGTVTLDNARLTDPGEIAKEDGQAVMTIDNTWTAEGLTFT